MAEDVTNKQPMTVHLGSMRQNGQVRQVYNDLWKLMIPMDLGGRGEGYETVTSSKWFSVDPHRFDPYPAVQSPFFAGGVTAPCDPDHSLFPIPKVI